MISIIPESKFDDFDLAALFERFKRALPAYAIPKFVRIQKDFDCTATHKIKKVNLKKAGFDPDLVTDPLYVLLPDASAYQPLTGEIYRAILNGQYRF